MLRPARRASGAAARRAVRRRARGAPARATGAPETRPRGLLTACGRRARRCARGVLAQGCACRGGGGRCGGASGVGHLWRAAPRRAPRGGAALRRGRDGRGRGHRRHRHGYEPAHPAHRVRGTAEVRRTRHAHAPTRRGAADRRARGQVRALRRGALHRARTAAADRAALWRRRARHREHPGGRSGGHRPGARRDTRGVHQAMGGARPARAVLSH